MAFKKRKVAVGAYRWYHTRGLIIGPSLAGTEHTFKYHGHDVKVSVPGRPGAKDKWNEDSAIFCRSWKLYKSGKRPTSFVVRRVSLVLDSNSVKSIREDAIGRVNTQLFSTADAKRLEIFAEKQGEILDKAFFYWASVVRWKCKRYSIMHSRDDLGISDSNLYLVERATMQRFYAPPTVIRVTWERPITEKEWKAVQESIRSQEEVPLWQLSIGEAHHRFSSGDSRGAILELAISVEVLVRHLVESFLSDRAPNDFRRMVSKIGLRQLLEQWERLGFKSKAWGSFPHIKRDILQVITLRDSIMHRGHTSDIHAAEFKRYSAAVLSFAASGEIDLRRRR